LRYSTPFNRLNQGRFLKQYGEAAYIVMNLFEDFRIDNLMMTSYSASSEIYEANTKTVLGLAEKYEQKKRFFDDLNGLKESLESRYTLSSNVMSEPVKILTEMIVKGTKYTLFDYLQGIIFESEKTPPTVKLDPVIQDYVKRTKHFINKARKCKNQQEVIDGLNTEVYPVIEELMKNYIDPEQQNQNAKMQVRIGIGNNPAMPKEWIEGDYTSLKDSVASAIKELTRRLRNIRVNDMVTRWHLYQRRGNLSIKDVYRFASGNFRVFKKKIENVDSVNELAFSILVDISVSMDGEPQIEATRGVIIMAETAEALGIPCEIIAFGYGSKTVKRFDQKLTPDIKKQIGGIVQIHSGGTNMFSGLKASRIETLKNKKRCLVALTDGATSNEVKCKLWFKRAMKNGISCYGFDLSHYNALEFIMMPKECVKKIDTAVKLPIAFESLIKSVATKVEGEGKVKK
jgi:hypothetical protein